MALIPLKARVANSANVVAANANANVAAKAGELVFY
jgi:hypothetical protein